MLSYVPEADLSLRLHICNEVIRRVHNTGTVSVKNGVQPAMVDGLSHHQLPEHDTVCIHITRGAQAPLPGYLRSSIERRALPHVADVAAALTESHGQPKVGDLDLELPVPDRLARTDRVVTLHMCGAL